MGDDLTRQLLSSIVIVALITFLTQLVLRLVDNRSKRREAAEAKAEERAEDAAEDAEVRRGREHDEFERMQSAYAQHISWDYRAIERNSAHERLIWHLQDRLGDSRTTFEPIGQPPSLRPPPRILPPPT